jgi:hypothetical protein
VRVHYGVRLPGWSHPTGARAVIVGAHLLAHRR